MLLGFGRDDNVYRYTVMWCIVNNELGAAEQLIALLLRHFFYKESIFVKKKNTAHMFE